MPLAFLGLCAFGVSFQPPPSAARRRLRCGVCTSPGRSCLMLRSQISFSSANRRITNSSRNTTFAPPLKHVEDHCFRISRFDVGFTPGAAVAAKNRQRRDTHSDRRHPERSRVCKAAYAFNSSTQTQPGLNPTGAGLSLGRRVVTKERPRGAGHCTQPERGRHPTA